MPFNFRIILYFPFFRVAKMFFVETEPSWSGNLLLERESRSNRGPVFRLAVDVVAVRVERSGVTCLPKNYYLPLIYRVLRLILNHFEAF